MPILALIQAATALTPILTDIVGIVEKSVSGAPISAVESDTVVSALTQASAEYPLLAPVLPIVQKQFDGVALTDADITTMESVSDAIDAQIATKTAAIESGQNAS